MTHNRKPGYTLLCISIVVKSKHLQLVRHAALMRETRMYSELGQETWKTDAENIRAKILDDRIKINL